MPVLNDLDTARLARLSVRKAKWQLATILMPKWVAEPGVEPFRPLLPFARCPEVPFLGGGPVNRPGDALGPGLLTALLRLANHAEVRYLPSDIAMRDADSIAALEPVLGPLGVTLHLVDSLPLIDEVDREMRQDLAGSTEALSILAGEDCSLPRVRGFAEAAAQFFRAEPWHWLSDADMIIAEGDVPKEMGCFSVLGGAHAITGIGFHPNRDAFESMKNSVEGRAILRAPKQWLISFDDPSHIAIRDSELWQDEQLPLAGPLAYPSFRAHTLGGGAEPADGERLVFGESLLRMLSETTEDELDSGKWTRTVMTADGERTLTLSLPGVLEQEMISEEQLAKMPPEARVIVLGELATRSEGRVFHRYIRAMLRHNPRSAEAYVLLADETHFDDRRLALIRKAFENAQAELDAAAVGEQLDAQLGKPEVTRYLGVRLSLAEELWHLGQREESFAHRHEMLRLAPSDPRGMHLDFIADLVEAGQLESAREVAGQFATDESGTMLFANALVAFAIGSAEAGADALLRRAMSANRFVAKYLNGSTLPTDDNVFKPAAAGTEAEAVQIAYVLEPAWSAVPGAGEWLKKLRRDTKKKRK